MKTFGFIVISIAILLFYYFAEGCKQSIESEKIAATNPYQMFDQALDCQCDKENVESPLLKVVALIKSENDHEKKQTWLLTNDKNQLFSFENDLNFCQALSFQKDDLVKIRGQISFQNKQQPLLSKAYTKLKAKSTVKTGYIQHAGKTYCVQP
jgi:hypothetical protein